MLITPPPPLLCFRYPSQHVHCSEQSLAGPGQSAGDKDPDGQGQEQELDSKQHEVCLKTCSSYHALVSLMSSYGALTRKEWGCAGGGVLPASEARCELSATSGSNLRNGLDSILPDFSAMRGIRVV